MKLYEILVEDGVIVPGVNTTVDVKPGETERQARKFFGGNGKPKPLGVKGATPNQAFNLGLTEEINPEILEPNFYKEKIVNTKLGQIKLVAQHYSSKMIPQIKIEAFIDNEPIGYVRFVVMNNDAPTGFLKKFKKANPYLLAGNLRVDDEYQRKGVATAMYKFAISLGNDIKPSTVQTDKGKAFWSSKPNEDK